MENKKILLISGCFYGQIVGGAEYQQYLIGCELQKHGYEVHYLFIDNGKPIRNDANFHLIPIRKNTLLRKLIGNYFFLNSIKVYRTIKKIAPLKILVRTGFSYVGIAGFYSRRHECQLIWHVASSKDLDKRKISLSLRSISDYIEWKFLVYGIKNTDKIICQAMYQTSLLEKNYNKNCNLILPNLHPSPTGKFKKKQTEIKILWIANLKQLKRPELFIKLAEHIDDDNVTFIMIGRASTEAWVTFVAEKTKLLKNFQYTGEFPIDEVNKILQESHILVNTSDYEGFPNTFIQAWLHGVPVVSLNVDPDNIIKNYKLGFHSSSFEQMEKDLRELITEKKLRQDFGANAYKYAQKNHCVDKQIHNLIKLLKY